VKALVFVVYFLIVGVAYSAPISQSVADEVYLKAQKIKDAELAGNHVYIVTVMPQPIIKKLGTSREKLIVAAKKINLMIRAKKFIFEKYEVSPPKQIFHFNKQTITFLKTRTVINTGKSRVQTSSYLLALKYDGDANWYFLNGKGIAHGKRFRSLFKLAPFDIKLPEVSVKLVK